MKKDEIDYKALYEQEHKKYGDAVERMKSWMNGEHPECFSEAQKAAEFVFPELAESGDERIRKALLDHIKGITSWNYFLGISREQMIAWLEKQDEKFACGTFVNVDDVREEFMREVYRVLDADSTNDRANQIIDAFDSLPTTVIVKQIEQIPTNKIESKFHEGDFIKHNKANIICKVISVNSGSYYVENIETNGRIELFNAEQNFHLWTIQDAKEGDVLADDYSIIIFRKIGNESWSDVVDYYVGWNYKNKSGIKIQSGKSHYGKIDDVDFKPATKEQRDFLFTKMKEDGYEWDVYNKVLRKIEQKPQTELPKGEDYAIDGLWQAIQILEHSLGEVDGWQSDDGILEHKCAIEAVKRLYEHKSAWSEEDETFLNLSLGNLTGLKNRFGEESGKVGDCIHWLKSLKERIQSQPKQELSEDAATNEYIDLGLPSGTLWEPFNEEGYYTYDEAVEKFGHNLPTKEQWEELKNECNWKWKGNGYDVTGPNGNMIFLPAAGYRYGTEVNYLDGSGFYWSGTCRDKDVAWYAYFVDDDIIVSHYLRAFGLIVRLVK